MRSHLFILLMLAATQLSAQYTKFSKSFGGSSEEQGRSVKETFDKGFIIAGATSSLGNGGMDVFLIKTDSLGNHEWSKTYGGMNSDWGYSVLQVSSDSGYIVAGYTNSWGNGGYDAYLIRTDKNGTELWSKFYGGQGWDFAYSLQQTLDGGFILAGATYSFGEGNSDAYLIRTDANGDTLWTMTYGGPQDDGARSVWQNADGGFFINGYTSSSGAGASDVYYIRTDASGNPLWTKTLGGLQMDESFSGQQTFDGGFVMVGYTNSFSGGTDEAYTIKVDANGDTLWTNRNGRPNNARAYTVCEGQFNQLAWAGWLTDVFSKDIYFFKTGPSGDYHTSTTHGIYKGEDIAHSIILTSDFGFAIVGSTAGYGQGLSDIYLIKTDNMGMTAAFNSVEDKSGSVSILVAPNPFSDQTTFTLTSSIYSGSFVFQLHDVTGREVLTKSFATGISSFVIDRNDLEAGVYFFSISTKEGSRAAGKIIIR